MNEHLTVMTRKSIDNCNVMPSLGLTLSSTSGKAVYWSYLAEPEMRMEASLQLKLAVLRIEWTFDVFSG